MENIDLIQHKNLLNRCRRLPFKTDPTRVYDATLKELYKKYKFQSNALKETIKLYEEIEILVNEKQPLITERKYVKVRKFKTV